MRFWCDGCRKEMSRVEVQWSGCADNGYRLLDFCGYPCAEKFRARVMGERRAKP